MNHDETSDLFYTWSLADRLKAIRYAINAVLYGGQRYSIGSRKLERAPLPELLKMERETLAAMGEDATSPLFGDTVVAIFDKR